MLRRVAVLGLMAVLLSGCVSRGLLRMQCGERQPSRCDALVGKFASNTDVAGVARAARLVDAKLRRPCELGNLRACLTLEDAYYRIELTEAAHREALEHGSACNDGVHRACMAIRDASDRAIAGVSRSLVSERTLSSMEALCGGREVGEGTRDSHSACRILATSFAAGLSLPRDFARAAEFSRMSCGSAATCPTADEPRLLWSEVRWGKDALISAELDRIDELLAADLYDEAREHFLSVVRFMDPRFGDASGEQLRWKSLAERFWPDVVDGAIARGELFTALGRIRGIAQFGPAGEGAPDSHQAATDELHRRAHDSQRPKGSRALYRVLAAQLQLGLMGRDAERGVEGARAVSERIHAFGELKGLALDFRLVNASPGTCDWLFTRTAEETEIEVVVRVTECSHRVEQRSRLQARYERLRATQGDAELTTTSTRGMVSSTGCGHDGSYACFGTIETTRAPGAAPSEPQLAGYDEVPYLVHHVALSARATYGGQTIEIREFSQDSHDMDAASSLDGASFMRRYLREEIDRQLGRSVSHSRDAVSSDDNLSLVDAEDRLVRMSKGAAGKAELAAVVGRHLGLRPSHLLGLIEDEVHGHELIRPALNAAR